MELWTPQSSSIYIQTLRIPEDRLVEEVRNIFGLNSYPFTDLDSNLILLAFNPRCDKTLLPRYRIERIEKRYGTCNYQTLEFYGDKVLYDLVIGLVYDVFGLSNTSNFLSSLVSYLTKNRTLTDIMLSKGACEYVRSGDYNIKEERSFHNYCADAFEALIGALYVHLKAKKLNYNEILTLWLTRNTNINFLLREYLSRIGTNNVNIYNINDVEELVENLKREGYKNVKGEDFASRSIIVDANEPLFSIYQRLSWPYQRPQWNGEEFQIYGYPLMEKKIIGRGRSEEASELDAKNYLTKMGYIVSMVNPERYFR